MCGLAGIIDPQRRLAPDTAPSMAAALVHRGPDAASEWRDSTLPASFAFRRLAILDLSGEANQPMHDGPLTILFNGEIYNYRDIRAELQRNGHSFKTSSDTEVLLKAFSMWGMKETLKKLNGMYAIALLNREEGSLSLARDRFGEKPLYYTEHNGALLFASELKALRNVLDLKICQHARALYLRYGFIPAPHTIHEGVAALQSGEWVTFDVQNLKRRTQGVTPRLGVPQKDFETALTRAVQIRLRADVPVGVFLSGGVDSSLILALAGHKLSRPVPSFTLRMEGDPNYDESVAAAAIARRCGSEHRIVETNAALLRDAAPNHIAFMDQPLADAAFIPLALLAKQSRQSVTVALSGEGGDELQAGYTRHKYEKIIKAFLGQKMPLNAAGALLLPVAKLLGLPQLQRQLDKARALPQGSPYQSLLSLWGVDAPLLPYKDFRQGDTEFYLPHDLLMKLDGATMKSSLEGRCPYLDPDLWATIDSMPRSVWQGKKLARALLKKYGLDVPQAKKGLTLPLADWLRGDLKDWAWTYIEEVKRSGFLPSAAIDKTWQDVQQGRSQHVQPLWALAVYGQWCKTHSFPL